MKNDIFRTVRELLESSKCVIMGNAVNIDGELYADSVENLTAILAMQDSYTEMLAALKWLACEADEDMPTEYRTDSFKAALDAAWSAITKADGEPA
jgi:hypothetical protein